MKARVLALAVAEDVAKEIGRIYCGVSDGEAAEIEVPGGFEVVGFRTPLMGELFLTNDGITERRAGVGWSSMRRLILRRKPVLVGWTVKKLGRPPKIDERYITTEYANPYIHIRRGSFDTIYAQFEAVSVEPIYE